VSAPVTAGQVIAGKYRVERVLGEGAFGVVVAAVHTQIGQRVALKFLQADALKQNGVVERFLREAQSAVQIQSEHVARVLDVGKLKTGAPYMVLEYLEGRDLSQVLQEQGPLPLAVAIDYVLQACEAIAEAHAHGIVHRDLKPANIFLTARADGSPLVKVLDFGISKASSRPLEGLAPASSLTRTHGMMGSPLYMAPEQVRSAKRVDARADIWSLGVILYELTTRQWPFFSTNVAGLFLAIGADPPTPLRKVWPECSPGFEAVVMRCLAKDVNLRYQSVAELAEALLPYAPGSQVSVQRIVRLQGRVAAAQGVVAPGQASPAFMVANTALIESDDAATNVYVPPRPVEGPAQSTIEWGRSSAEQELPSPKRRVVMGVVGSAVLVVGAVMGTVTVLNYRTAQPRTEPAASLAAPPPAVEMAPAATTSSPASSSAPSPAAASSPLVELPAPVVSVSASVAHPSRKPPPKPSVRPSTTGQGDDMPNFGPQH
jgi:eukaryotic-like serine/threonine-protein kinase